MGNCNLHTLNFNIIPETLIRWWHHKDCVFGLELADVPGFTSVHFEGGRRVEVPTDLFEQILDAVQKFYKHKKNSTLHKSRSGNHVRRIVTKYYKEKNIHLNDVRLVASMVIPAYDSKKNRRYHLLKEFCKTGRRFLKDRGYDDMEITVDSKQYSFLIF